MKYSAVYRSTFSCRVYFNYMVSSKGHYDTLVDGTIHELVKMQMVTPFKRMICWTSMEYLICLELTLNNVGGK